MRYTCLSHCVPCCVPNEIDYGKINVETNLGADVSRRTTSLIWRNLKNMQIVGFEQTSTEFY